MPRPCRVLSSKKSGGFCNPGQDCRIPRMPGFSPSHARCLPDQKMQLFFVTKRAASDSCPNFAQERGRDGFRRYAARRCGVRSPAAPGSLSCHASLVLASAPLPSEDFLARRYLLASFPMLVRIPA